MEVDLNLGLIRQETYYFRKFRCSLFNKSIGNVIRTISLFPVEVLE